MDGYGTGWARVYGAIRSFCSGVSRSTRPVASSTKARWLLARTQSSRGDGILHQVVDVEAGALDGADPHLDHGGMLRYSKVLT